jgi:CheY-like chemotaxis protein
MHHGGSVTIRTRNLTELPQRNGSTKPSQGEERRGRFVWLSVSDTGSGMPPDVLALAFEPFFTTKPAGEGTGLGLATVHSIVQQAGGRIAVQSEPDQGTTVNVYLPASDEAVVRTTGDEPDDGCGGTETIVIVDDEEAICDIAEQLLRAAGYWTASANSGAAAIELARSMPRQIDLLLTDLVMPLMSGSELAGEFAAHRPETRVLYMSGYAASRFDDEGVITPDVTILAKPFTGAALRRAVRVVLNAERTPR